MAIQTIAAALLLACMPAHADIHKCHQGTRILYQEAPCPSNSQSLNAPTAPPQPDSLEVARARAQASKDVAAAEAIRKREAVAALALQRKRAAVRRQEVGCAALLDKIEVAEAREKLNKSQKSALKSNRHKYLQACGPL